MKRVPQLLLGAVLLASTLGALAQFDEKKPYGRICCTVQRAWLQKLRQERGLLEAVQLAGPFILSSQGPINQRKE